MKYIKIIIFSSLFFIIIELLLRVLGIFPNTKVDSKTIEKEYRDNYEGYMCNNKDIGIIPCESRGRIIYQAGLIPFRVTHYSDGSRFCGTKENAHKLLLLTGDSNIHGDGVDDTCQVGFKLQNKLSEFRVLNRAIPGSGTVSQLLVLKDQIKSSSPEIVIATYASYHNERNIFSRSFKKVINVPESKRHYFKFPVATLKNDSFEIALIEYSYHPFPLSNLFSSFELINRLIEQYEYHRLNADKVTMKIWQEYITVCRKNKIKLCVLITTEDRTSKEIEKLFIRNKVQVVKANVINANTLMPKDPHWNCDGHTYVSDLLAIQLNKIGWINN